MESDGKEAVSRVKIMEEIYIILSELIDHRNDISKTKFDTYLKERNIYSIKLFKAKQISMRESYISRVRKDILSKNTDFNEDSDPAHIELVSRCLKKLKEKPWVDVDTIITETRNEMHKENYCQEKKIIREFSYKECEIINVDGSRRIYFEKKNK